MKIRKNLFLTVVLLSLVFLPTFSLNFNSTVVAQEEVPDRTNTVWAAGYQTKAEDLMPYTNNPAYGVAFMYEPLFGYNFLKDEPIPVIGTSYEWSSDGSSITVDLNPNAKWSDGSTIDADDVVYSYNLAAKQVKFKADMTERIDSVEKVDADTVKFNLKSAYKFSFKLEEWLTTDVFIVPQQVWEEISASEALGNGSLDSFNNDWFANNFDNDWKVCSGPYKPYSRSSTLDEEIYVRRDDWWGKNLIHTDINSTLGVPQVKYIGLRQYPTNTAQDTALLTGDIDLHAGFYDKIWIGMGINPSINTWFGKKSPYYLGLGSVIEIASNHLRYPFVETWFRKAVAYCLDYDTIAYVAGSGYWSKARQGFIDDRSPTQLSVYDPDVQSTYGIDYDFAEAVSILQANCYQDSSGEWWVNDVPAEYQSMPGASGGDQDLAHAGYNVKLGGYEILVPSGWSDVVKATKLWSEYITELNITCSKKEIDFGTAFIPNLADNDYGMAMHVTGPHLVNPALMVFGGQRGTHQWNSNVTNWYNPEYNNLYESYETLEPGSTAQKEAASQMQELLATEIPSIPTHANGFWYAYSTQYWDGWVSEDNAYNHVCTAYTVNQAAVKCRLILALTSTGAVATTPWTGITFYVILIFCVAALFVMKKRRKETLI